MSFWNRIEGGFLFSKLFLQGKAKPKTLKPKPRLWFKVFSLRLSGFVLEASSSGDGSSKVVGMVTISGYDLSLIFGLHPY